jgi:putative transcriptional regulator
MKGSAVFSAAAAALLFACAALAQPAAVLLVAKPGLADPNFIETVVLVTHAPGGETIGVVLNRPTRARLSEVAPEFPNANAYGEPLYRGGPVLPTVIVALFRSSSQPDASAFPVLPGTYLTLHPRIIDRLLEKSASQSRRDESDSRFRLFAGFSGWAAGQLEAEMTAGGWYALPASEDILFRSDTSGLWRELVEKARNRHTSLHGEPPRGKRGLYLPG